MTRNNDRDRIRAVGQTPPRAHPSYFRRGEPTHHKKSFARKELRADFSRPVAETRYLRARAADRSPSAPVRSTRVIADSFLRRAHGIAASQIAGAQAVYPTQH